MIDLVRFAEAPADPALSKLGTALPFAAALALLLLSPLFTAKVKRLLAGQIATDSASYDVRPSTPLPPHLTPEAIGDYVEYAADVVQIVPLTFLPIFGAIFAISSDISRIPALAVLGFTVIIAVAIDTWLASCSAADYVSRKRFGYSLVTGVAITSNAFSLAVVLMFN
jgi:hypothetical protein